MGEMQPQDSPVLDHILTSHLVAYTNDITFPWPDDKPLDGSDVGRVFFGKDYDATPDWLAKEVKTALSDLSQIGLKHLTAADLVNAALTAEPPPRTTYQSWQRIIGLILLLDQGSRYTCKTGTNARYIYDYFDELSLHIVKLLVETQSSILSLSAWKNHSPVDIHQALLRILMVLPPLVHSEDLADQVLHLNLTETLRREYEDVIGRKDPHRATVEADKHGIYLFGQILDAGPPRGDGVEMSDFIFWMMRYYTSHVAYVRHFGGRSPFRNVAVGRPDEKGEKEWLEVNHVFRSEEGEKTRRRVAEDIAHGRWTPLKL